MREFYTEAEMQRQLDNVQTTLTRMMSSKIPPIIILDDDDRIVERLLSHVDTYAATKHHMIIFVTTHRYQDFMLKAKFQSQARFEPTRFNKLRQHGYLGRLNSYDVYTNEGVVNADSMPDKTGVFFLPK